MSDAPAVPSSFRRFDARTGEFVPPAAPAAAPDDPAAQRRQSDAAGLGLLSSAVLLGALLLVYFYDGGAGGSGGRGRERGARARGGDELGSQWEEPYHASGRKREDTRTTLSVTLADLWSGCEVRNVSVTRDEVCSVCHGAGGSGHEACPVCGGRGYEVLNMQMGHGRYQRVQRQCGRCGGEGRIVRHVCSACGGEGHATKRVQLPVVLSGGLQGGDIVRLPGQGDQHRQVGPGDVLVHLVERRGSGGGGGGGRSGSSGLPVAARPKKPEVVRQPRRGSDEDEGGGGGEETGHEGAEGAGRRSDDLEAELAVTLREALLGFERRVLHPGSGEEVVVAAGAQGLAAASDWVLLLAGKGMPRRPSAAQARQRAAEDGASVVEMQKPGLAKLAAAPGAVAAATAGRSYGDLRVRVSVRLPERLTDLQRSEVDRLFPETPEERLRREAAATAAAAGTREEELFEVRSDGGTVEDNER